MAPAKEESRDFLRGMLTTFALGLGVILFGQLVFTFLVAPHLRISRVTIRSDARVSESEVLRIGGLEGDLSFLTLDEASVKSRLESHPEISSARVEKIFPQGLELEIRSRKPLALSLVSGKEETVPVAFDVKGVIFRIGSEIADWDRPVLSGIRYESVERGLTLPEALHPLLRDLETLQRQDPGLYSLISEIRVVRRGWQDFELLLCLSGYSLKIRIGNSLNSQLLRQAILVLDMMEDRGLTGTLDEVDFRTGEVVFSVQGE